VAYRCEYAWVAGAVARDVRIVVAGDRIVSVTPNDALLPPATRLPAPRPPATRLPTTELPGLTLPGLANAHSHAFHRALRGRTHDEKGTFWTWRERMYAVADRLDPDRYLALARAVYAEMALAGITCVGEFHYLHHGPGGTPYAEPNAMGEALLTAAAEAGIRITLLDACYLTGGIGQLPEGPQLRFADRNVDAWAARAAAILPREHAKIGGAIHSVRAVPPTELEVVASWAYGPGVPLHTHLSERRAENADCLAAYGRTPTVLLAERGALDQGGTVVHAIHLTAEDIAEIGRGGTRVCLCPTTERDLADGIGPAPELAAAGAPIVLGSDSHAVVDLFEEARAVELDERLRSGRRGCFGAAALLAASTVDGHRSLGWYDAGKLEARAVADLVTVALDTPRTAGVDPVQAVFAATAADVRHVVAGGRVVVRDGVHQWVDVGPALAAAIAEVVG